MLSEDNYEQWKRCLKNYLVGHGLWGVVSGKESEPSKLQKQEHDEWKKKNALALHAIQISCGTGIYSKFNKAHISSHYAWTHLAEKASGLRSLPPIDHEEELLTEDNGNTKSFYFMKVHSLIICWTVLYSEILLV